MCPRPQHSKGTFPGLKKKKINLCMNSLYVKQALQRQRFISAHFQAPVVYFGCIFTTIHLGNNELHQEKQKLTKVSGYYGFMSAGDTKPRILQLSPLAKIEPVGLRSVWWPGGGCRAAGRRCLFTVIQAHCKCKLLFTVDPTASQECFHTPAQVPGRFSGEDRDTFLVLSPP